MVVRLVHPQKRQQGSHWISPQLLAMLPTRGKTSEGDVDPTKNTEGLALTAVGNNPSCFLTVCIFGVANGDGSAVPPVSYNCARCVKWNTQIFTIYE